MAQAIGNDNPGRMFVLSKTKNKLFFLSIPILYLLPSTYVLKTFLSYLTQELPRPHFLADFFGVWIRFQGEQWGRETCQGGRVTSNGK